MEPSASITSAQTLQHLFVKDPFEGGNRMRKELAALHTSNLYSKLWSRLPEEVLLQVFARLPVKDILRMRSLNQTWRSTITSLHFQAAFEGASLARIALMLHDKVDGTMFLTQDKGQECFRPGIARCPQLASCTNVAATANGLVCILEHERKPRTNPELLIIRVYVMNVVTGIRRALPHPSEMPTLPSFVRMETTQPEGGYTVTFIYALAGFLSWEVYDSVENRWSKNEEGSKDPLDKNREVFAVHSRSFPPFYENIATFNNKAKTVSTFDLYASHRDFCGGSYIAHSVDVASGDMYRLCAVGGKHGVWRKLLSTGTFELVCECPQLERTWSCVRVMKDVVVLVLKLPFDCLPDAELSRVLGDDVGTVVKVFHMPTKSWHSFPEKDYVVQNWGVSIRKDYAGPFLVEMKFDVVP